MNKSLDYISKNDPEYDWLVNNSYKYGFILRYPEGKEKITGYMYEEEGSGHYTHRHSGVGE
jgi:D-alanyl-D-alanine carboxypeptidase